MLSSAMEKVLNDQINAELDSFYIYLSMAAYAESINLEGFASWMRIQAQEEMGHAMKIYDFIHERDGRVTLQKLGKPPSDWANLKAMVEAAHAQERDITEKIDQIVNQAVKEKDHATNAFMQWFVTEQVEELATINTLLNQLELIDGAPGGLFLLDQEMSKRQDEDEE